jgi:pyruvate-formate lyase-activating enzyme
VLPDAGPDAGRARAARPVYGRGGSLPVHAAVDDEPAQDASRVLIRLHRALLGLPDGRIVCVSSPRDEVTAQLQAFGAASGHALLSVIPDPQRPGWTIHYLRKGPARTDWAPLPAAVPAATGPTVDELMPTRLWLYTNYDCNLACDYCCVVAGPRADPRRLTAERIRELADEAAAAGLREVFLTGGEPTLRPDLAQLIAFITDRLPLTLLTNAMLLRGPRWDRLRPLIEAGRPVVFQVSLDSAAPERHDAHRGRGAHAAALAGIRLLLGTGAHVRLAASVPEAALGEIPELHRLAETLGIAEEDRIIRPIALRGAADEGEAIRPADIAPELTCDAQGWFWHPLSNDPDMRLGLPADASVTAALAVVRARLASILADDAARLERFVCG